ncbi:cupin domain-containing protein [Brevundimonas sp.]|uniref:cupin domain-containing protein n=1 Tax=Brevundimonas sp. TaxID=1871086 RepID=UPI003D0A9395
MRRVITGIVAGKSVVLEDGAPAHFHHFAGWPGHAVSVVWATSSTPSLPISGKDEPRPGLIVAPAPGETRLLTVTFPPDSVFSDPGFDGQAYEAEANIYLKGLIDTFEPDAPGMHRTNSIDYAVVIEGEVWLELDDGVETRFGPGDLLVQGGVRHAWRNKSESKTTILFVLVGAHAAE